MAEPSNLEILEREWDVVFKAPVSTRENSLRSFLRQMGMSGIKEYDYERLIASLVSPSGPIRYGSQQPSLLERYKTLSEDERQQFHKYVDDTFNDIRAKWPEAYNEYQTFLNTGESIFTS